MTVDFGRCLVEGIVVVDILLVVVCMSEEDFEIGINLVVACTIHGDCSALDTGKGK